MAVNGTVKRAVKGVVKGTRLDLALVKRGLAPSRAQAQDMIRRGLVAVAGKVEIRAAAGVGEDDAVAVAGAPRYVSRGGLKLAAALDHFAFAVTGVVALDIGASTGGFTEVLLARGAARVYAVDVGHGQLHSRLARLPAVVSLEGHDARALDGTTVPEPVGAIVADVSFISLTKALPAALALAAPQAWLIGLIKPQFEAGRSAVGKGGIVRAAADRQRAIELVAGWLGAQAGWRLADVIPSPIRGGSGNQEFLIGAVHGG
jgi:23S rRNA (cytidine1920-2'-O)/16S rRNA (cytidine1409-2'-O)-methyltransferase